VDKNQFVALGLSEEQAEKAAAASSEELKGFIPKARFDEVNAAKKAAEKDVADRDKQIDELGKAAGASEELKKQIETLKTENESTKQKHETELKDMKLNAAIEKALTDAHAKHPELLKVKIDKAKLELLEDGTAKGLEDQIKPLQESYKELFASEDKGGQFQFKGFTPPQGGDKGGGGSKNTAVDFGKQIADFAKANAATSDAQKTYFGG
jgi:hypothetical protein